MNDPVVSRQSSRRGFLGGLGGAVLGLPWLESVARAERNESPALVKEIAGNVLQAKVVEHLQRGVVANNA